MPRRGRARRHLVVSTLVGLLVAGCTAGPSSRPAVLEGDSDPAPETSTETTPDVPLPDLSEPRNPALRWSDCPPELLRDLDGTDPAPEVSCARISLSLDAPGLPGLGLTRIGVSKVGTGRIPLVVLNDVGGEPGTRYAVQLARTLPDEVLETFSLIGVDRRGTGTSDALRCIPEQERETLLSHDPATSVDPLLDAARTAGQQCAIALEDVQTAYDSWRTAGDLEELRIQLGVDHLNVLGHGDGSVPAAYYAARFPDRAGRIVLDGVPDPSTDPTGVLGDVAAGAEATLDEFTADCARRNCPLGDDARAVVTELADNARATPLRAGEHRLNSTLVRRAVLAGLSQPGRWVELADAVDAARSGDASRLAAFVTPWLDDDPSGAPRTDGVLVTRCNDTASRLPHDQLREAARALRSDHPVFGAVVAQPLVWCSPWPSRQENVPDLGSPEAPPVLVLSTATDPLTPERGTVRAAEQIPSAVRVAWQGAGHGALGSPCVGQEVAAFLVDGDVPRDGTLCPA
ncbi:alpha/beta hydrolase [Saccharomonospora sp. NB11]|uniref:alpha/beta hydrolase n=1 Tax=Saccharomonospora sp. NB11 TaxID=1642298 RepID=UPI0018D18E1B|nr:alpha/beta hydrolase [Saccharomonospora sp. NB11]